MENRMAKKSIFEEDFNGLSFFLARHFRDATTPITDLAFKFGTGVLNSAIPILLDSPGAAEHLLNSAPPEISAYAQRIYQATDIVSSTKFVEKLGMDARRAGLPFTTALVKLLIDDLEELWGKLSDEVPQDAQICYLVTYFLMFACCLCERHRNAALMLRCSMAEQLLNLMNQREK
jgi:hypothetical protein